MESEMKAMRSSVAAMYELYSRALGDGTGQRAEEIRLDVCDTIDELLSLEEKLKEDTFRKRVPVGGPNPGENTRRVMRAVSSYNVWKKFSLKGKKGKRPLQNMIVMKVIKKAVMRSNPGLQQDKVEDIVADTLKHAPASLLTQKIVSMESEMKAMRSSVAAMYELYARALGDGTGQRAEEISLDVCGTTDELLSLEEKLKDETFRKRVTHHLSLVGGPNPGENTRRVMRAVASYNVWKEFSLKGKKGKRPLQNMNVMKVIKKAVMRSNPGLHQAKVEDIVADTLKHAPARTHCGGRQRAEENLISQQNTAPIFSVKIKREVSVYRGLRRPCPLMVG
ncbi:von Willebrand factor A domain-containing protein 3A [Labeo rohita]|uniref:von Willebrand factor A domain-containing protein 3A n=1 Tax=Labeo rohita TaxID=84645 RepID=A0ABQ8L7S4_LABRO|nr:von Willebrand factor A domain-containing protein 3A [Labeo rohita]